MIPFYTDSHVTLYNADVLAGLRALPDGSVHCCVTSPPYWGLRDYGTAEWEGGDADCGHLAGALVSQKSGLRNDGRDHVGPYEGEKAVTTGMPYRDTCGKCGATRKDHQLGLESTPEEYVARMVEVFREVRRVLRDDGTLWLNLGDSYATQGGDRDGHLGSSTLGGGHTLDLTGGHESVDVEREPRKVCVVPHASPRRINLARRVG